MSVDAVLWADRDDLLPADYREQTPPEVIIAVGDLSGFAVEQVAEAFPQVPILGVYGNHCRRGYLDDIPSATNLAGPHIAGGWTLGQQVVLGIEGCVRYKDDTDILYTQDEYAARLDSITEPVDVVITHCPPRGCNDHADAAHQGIDALARLVRRCGVQLLVHGHTYPENPVTEFEGAQVVYVHGWQRMQLPLASPGTW